MGEKRLIALILLIYLILGTVYSLKTPPFEASDELWHYPMIEHLANGHPLPVQVWDPALAGPWKQEASQPPLYYYLGALLTFPIDTSDMFLVRRLNPHVDNGVITKDGNINLIVHDPELNRWSGSLLALQIVRFSSVIMGAFTVYLTYRLGRYIAPKRPEIGLGAAALHAFMPMFLFISGAVNNDNLVIPLISYALLLMIQEVRQEREGREWGRWFQLGLLIGFGMLTKITAVGLLPLSLGVIFIALWERSNKKVSWRSLFDLLGQTLMRWGVVIVGALTVSGWWYYRNIQLYGDWRGWNAFIAVLGERAHEASLQQLWGERWGFMLSYWGLFGGVNVPMSNNVYYFLNSLLLLAIPGFIFYFWLENRSLVWQPSETVGVTVLLTRLFNWVGKNIGLVLMILWGMAVVLGLIQWATTTWSSQGRLVFSAISALTILWVLGLAGWMERGMSQLVLFLLVSFMLGVGAVAPFVWIDPAYQRGMIEPPEGLNEITAVFGQELLVTGYLLDPDSVEVGGGVDLYVQWEVVSKPSKDWSIFIHFVDPVLGTPIAQRDLYFGQGLVGATMLEKGDRFIERYHIELPETAVAPTQLEVQLGLYDFPTGERLLLLDQTDLFSLTQFSLQAKEGGWPNPVSINFEGELSLVGFEITPRRLKGGESVQVTLYWRPERQLTVDYSFFVQIVGEENHRWGSLDVVEKTHLWPMGAVRALELDIPVDPETVGNIYPIILGVYTQPSPGEFDRLQLLTEDGRLTDDFIELTKIRIEE